MFVAENHFKALVGKDFVGLGSGGAADHVRRKRFEHPDKRLADLQARRNHEGANTDIRTSIGVKFPELSQDTRSLLRLSQ